MAFYFTSTPVDSKNKTMKWGDKTVNFGSWASDGVSGTVDTGLRECEGMILTPKGSGLVNSACTVVSALPTWGDSIEISFDLATSGYWFAVGK